MTDPQPSIDLGPPPELAVAGSISPWHPWLLGLLYWMTLLPVTISPRHSGNVWSRYLTIESLVERGTLAVDGSPLLAVSGTPDVVTFRGRFYSDKPPVLSVIASGIYAPLAWSGIRFAGSPQQFVLVNLVLVWTVVGSCSALTLVWLRQMLQTLSMGPRTADVLAVLFGYGSLLFVYSGTFNNHSVAAGLITGAVALVYLERPGEASPAYRRAASGLMAGLAAVIDLPAGGVVLVALGVWLGLRGRACPWAFLAGAALPLLAHAVLQSLVTGTPLPAESYPQAFLYEGSYWATDAGMFRESGARWQFGLEFLVGPQGWLTVTPVLALGLIGLVTFARSAGPLRPAARALLAATIALVTYYVWFTRRTDFAGESFGTRHLLAISPLVYFFAAAVWSRLKHPALRGAFILLAVLGVAYSAVGVADPWMRIERRSEPSVRALQRLVLYPWSSYSR